MLFFAFVSFILQCQGIIPSFATHLPSRSFKWYQKNTGPVDDYTAKESLT